MYAMNRYAKTCLWMKNSAAISSKAPKTMMRPPARCVARQVSGIFQRPGGADPDEVIWPQQREIIAHHDKQEQAAIIYKAVHRDIVAEGDCRLEAKHPEKERNQGDAEDLENRKRARPVIPKGAPDFRVDILDEPQQRPHEKINDGQKQKAGRLRSPAVDIPADVPMDRHARGKFIPQRRQEGEGSDQQGEFKPA